jgi:hypothetical protein
LQGAVDAVLKTTESPTELARDATISDSNGISVRNPRIIKAWLAFA